MLKRNAHNENLGGNELLDLIMVCNEMTKEEFLKETEFPRMGKFDVPEDCPHGYGLIDTPKKCIEVTCRECWDNAVTKAEIKFKEEI